MAATTQPTDDPHIPPSNSIAPTSTTVNENGGPSASDLAPTASPTPSTAPSEDGRASEDESHSSSSPPGRRRSDSSISEPLMDDRTAERDGNQDKEPELPANNQEPTKPRSSSGASSSMTKKRSHDNIPRLAAADMKELMSSPHSLPVAPAPVPPQRHSIDQEYASRSLDQRRETIRQSMPRRRDTSSPAFLQPNDSSVFDDRRGAPWQARDQSRRPLIGPRPVSTPPTSRTPTDQPSVTSSPPRRNSFQPMNRPPAIHLNLNGGDGLFAKGGPPPAMAAARGTPIPRPSEPAPSAKPSLGPRPPSPVPPIIPLPPTSLPTYLQLELAAERPSPLYIHRSAASDLLYESSAVKFERLKNVLLLPFFLERTMNFGAFACLDAWLHNFTILPIRFILALALLVKWWGYIISKETRWLVGYVWYGLGRLWERERTGRSRRPSDISQGDRSRSQSDASEVSTGVDSSHGTLNRPRGHRLELRMNGSSHVKSPMTTPRTPQPSSGSFRHRRTKSVPSSLSSFHKADLLQGALIICSSVVLMSLDASRMYHFIRAQSTIKLYVIFNLLEVGDRLLSAIGQDILECLFSDETLSRNTFGRSKILLPMGMFLLALVYNCFHAVLLYYQVVTLNVAVNSYSNALLTLLLSNQFVEIKSTVFKRFEKDNLFQLTCADIVERFHLWVMLLIIGLRNVVEVGGLSVPGAGTFEDGPVQGGLHNPSILPHSFTVLPSWIMSGEVLSPFLIVVGSEMLVDAIKHAYVAKFNNIKPTFYSRILDILCKDYYTQAFTTPSLTRRLGLAVIPLSCLFIRASIQTYHMFLSTHLPMPIPPSTQTSLSEESAVPSSPAMLAALNRFDSLIRDSLGRATYGYPYGSPLNARPWYAWTSDDFIAALTMVVFFFITFLVLLIVKLVLGMVLLQYARNRYAKMKQKEHLIANGKLERESYDAEGKRIGSHGEVEVGEDRQRWIHVDKMEGLRGGKGPGGKRVWADNKKQPVDGDCSGVSRFEMVAKRIW